MKYSLKYENVTPAFFFFLSFLLEKIWFYLIRIKLLFRQRIGWITSSVCRNSRRNRRNFAGNAWFSKHVSSAVSHRLKSPTVPISRSSISHRQQQKKTTKTHLTPRILLWISLVPQTLRLHDRWTKWKLGAPGKGKKCMRRYLNKRNHLQAIRKRRKSATIVKLRNRSFKMFEKRIVEKQSKLLYSPYITSQPYPLQQRFLAILNSIKQRWESSYLYDIPNQGLKQVLTAPE